jgi:hypothetical protein
MRDKSQREPAGHRPRRRGFTYVELTMAMGITVMIALGAGLVMRTVQTGADYTYGHGAAAQHARVVVERIERAVEQSAASTDYPPFVVLADTFGTWKFPETLVVWRADANNDRIPQVNELVVFCPNPNAPNVLWELTATTDARFAPLADAAALTPIIDGLKSSGGSQKTVLTELVHRGIIPEESNKRRAAVRFVSRLQPTAAEWAAYRGGTLNWNQLAWAQGIYGSSTGLRQAWLRFELLLTPVDNAATSGDNDYPVIPFFGSATRHYELRR